MLQTPGPGLPGRAPGASGTRPRPLLVIKLLPALGPADCHSQETLWGVQLLSRVTWGAEEEDLGVGGRWLLVWAGG